MSLSIRSVPVACILLRRRYLCLFAGTTADPASLRSAIADGRICDRRTGTRTLASQRSTFTRRDWIQAPEAPVRLRSCLCSTNSLIFPETAKRRCRRAITCTRQWPLRSEHRPSLRSFGPMSATPLQQPDSAPPRAPNSSIRKTEHSITTHQGPEYTDEIHCS